MIITHQIAKNQVQRSNSPKKSIIDRESIQILVSPMKKNSEKMDKNIEIFNLKDNSFNFDVHDKSTEVVK